MSASRIDRAHAYRKRAEELRAVAEATFLIESHELLMRLAGDYERIAAALELRETAQVTEPPEDVGRRAAPMHR